MIIVSKSIQRKKLLKKAAKGAKLSIKKHSKDLELMAKYDKKRN